MVGVQGANIDIRQTIGAGGGEIQTAQKVHQRGFAASRLSHDSDKLSLFDLEADPFKSRDSLAAQFITFAEIFDFYQGFYLERRRNNIFRMVWRDDEWAKSAGGCLFVEVCDKQCENYAEDVFYSVKQSSLQTTPHLKIHGLNQKVH